MLEPHHDPSPLYVSNPAPSLGDTVRLRLRVPTSLGPVRAVCVRSNPDREPRLTAAELTASADGWDWWDADVVIENPVYGYRWGIRTEGGDDLWINARGVFAIETLDSEDFRLITHPPAPAWSASSVMYQIFPDRFARSAGADERQVPEWAIPAGWSDEVDLLPPGRSRQFYGGDLDGIVEHLDHLERLGVTMIYLTPVFPGRSNHRYDAANFDAVDPALGGNDALVRLVEAAHALGLKVIGDLTTNHSGDTHDWFVAAHRHPEALESDFYYWLDDAQENYASWLGAPSLPKFNWNSGELRRRFIEGPDSVVARWLEPPFVLDGWRIDVANMTGRYGAEDLNQAVAQTIRRSMIDVNPDTILLAESTNDAASDFQGDGWHGAMTYSNFTRPLWGWLSSPAGEPSGGFGMSLNAIPSYTGTQFYEAHRQFSAGFPWQVRLANMNALDTHDTPRFATRALPGTIPVALGLSMTLPGIPVVFAGAEFGLTGIDGEQSRAPIPWRSIDDAAERIDLYAQLIALRRAHPALNTGGIRWLHAGDEVLVFVREDEHESILVVASRAGFDVLLPPDAVAGVPAATRLFGAAALSAEPGGIRLAGTGPAFAVWQAPAPRVGAD